jgi:hypothetical protein
MRYFEKISKKLYQMNKLEKADREYAIAKSEEREGHPGKAKEHKVKASKEYKQAGKSGNPKFKKEAQTNEPKKTKKKRTLNDFYMKAFPNLVYPIASPVQPDFYDRAELVEDVGGEGEQPLGISEKIRSVNIDKSGLQLPTTEVPFEEPVKGNPIETNISSTSFDKIKEKSKKLLQKRYKKPIVDIIFPKWMRDKHIPVENYTYIETAVPTNGKRAAEMQ